MYAPQPSRDAAQTIPDVQRILSAYPSLGSELKEVFIGEVIKAGKDNDLGADGKQIVSLSNFVERQHKHISTAEAAKPYLSLS
jgi:hypothetical protein